jgi:uncharacterized protein (DUF433 family)
MTHPSMRTRFLSRPRLLTRSYTLPRARSSPTAHREVLTAFLPSVGTPFARYDSGRGPSMHRPVSRGDDTTSRKESEGFGSELPGQHCYRTWQARWKALQRDRRITVDDVLEYLASGMSAQDIIDDVPDLTPEDIRACLALAADRERTLVAAIDP